MNKNLLQNFYINTYRANHVKIHGTKYEAGTIIWLKKPLMLEKSFDDVEDFTFRTSTFTKITKYLKWN